MEPIHVIYMGGESRDDPDTAVDYMRADVPIHGRTIELYAEMPAGEGENDIYDALRVMILDQAKAHKLSDCLVFPYDSTDIVYTVVCNAIEYYHGYDVSKAIATANNWASTGDMYVIWWRKSDGQFGYLNRDGHDIVGRPW